MDLSKQYQNGRIVSIGKPQTIRLIDVFFLSPLMIWTALNYKAAPKAIRVIWFTSGILTAFYNGRNYMIQRKIDKLNSAPGGDLKTILYAQYDD